MLSLLEGDYISDKDMELIDKIYKKMYEENELA
jgi:hypothetical protein